MIIRIMLTILILSVSVSAYDKIIQFDSNNDIIITTTVYNTSGKPCIGCSCNLTLYKTYPNDADTFISVWMENKGNGIYSYALTDYYQINYSEYVYPISITCNQSSVLFAGDDRDGIKVSETMYDYSSAMMAVIGVAIGLLLMSFKMDKQYEYIKKITFFSSFAFMFASVALGYVILDQSPAPTDFIVIMTITATALLMVIFAVLFMYFKERLEQPITKIGQGRHT